MGGDVRDPINKDPVARDLLKQSEARAEKAEQKARELTNLLAGTKFALGKMSVELERVTAERDEARAQRDAYALDVNPYLPEPEDRCTSCSGHGKRTYGSTATWRGGLGGQMMTNGVCDGCWGSGDRHNPWPRPARESGGEGE